MDKYDKGQFSGMDFRQSQDCQIITVSMQRYIDCKLDLMDEPSVHSAFQSTRAQLSWTTNCRPDISCAVGMSAQVTQKEFNEVQDPKQMNRIIRHLKRHKLSILFPALDRKSLHIRAYPDACHANNREHSSRLGFVITLCDGHSRCAIIACDSYKM